MLNTIKRRVSLKWKVGIVLCLLLMVDNLGLISFNTNILHQQFKENLHTTDSNHRQQLSAIITLEEDRLLRLGSIVLALFNESTDDYLILNSLWQSLQFEWGLERLIYLGVDGTAIYTSGKTLDSEDLEQELRFATANEEPVTFISCTEYCRINALIPVLRNGMIDGFFLLSHSLTDLMITLNNTSQAVTGILSVEQANQSNPSRFLPAWASQVTALTLPDINLPILSAFSEQFSLTELQQAAQTLGINDIDYRLQLVPVNQPEGKEAYFLFLTDISSQLQTIRNQSRINTLTGGFALFILLLLVLRTLHAPMSRLQKIVDSFPLLAAHDFSGFRAQVGTVRSDRTMPDEIDELNHSAISLAHELQHLQGNIEQHAKDLEQRSEELVHERDFINSVLDTAQVVIVTTDGDGLIKLLNHYGEKLCGFSEQEMLGKPFYGFFMPSEDDITTRDALHDICQGTRSSYQNESSFVRPDGRKCQISWLHTRLHSPSSAAQKALMISVGVDISERMEAQQRLAWLADHDPLTSIYNRRRFQTEFRNTLEFSLRYECSGALLYLDLDEFKLVNDTCGHQVGDKLLQSISKSLLNITRNADIVARIGGDEFAVVMKKTEAAGAIHVAEKIIETISGIEIEEFSKDHSISTSIGIVQFPQHGSDINELLANADLAMYQAKEEGKNRWHLFESSDKSRERMQQQSYWKKRIEMALREDRFLLYYQPIVDIASGWTSHYEVLLRMTDDDGNLVTPGRFIGVAEQVGLVHAIDHWVIRKAIETLGEMNHNYQAVSFSINLSGRVINDRNLLPLIREVLHRPGIDASRVVFELTETSAVADIDSAKQLMHEIRELGCRFALDDFGVGFASFAYLKQLPMDFVKIDGSFIRNLPANRDDQLFVKALTDVARGMGKKTIAEFVEDGQTLDMLAKYGVDYAQGYFIGKPAPELSANEPLRSIN